MTPAERDRFLALPQEWRKSADAWDVFAIKVEAEAGKVIAMMLRTTATAIENLVRDMESKDE